jgi:Glycosyl hydrolases family 28
MLFIGTKNKLKVKQRQHLAAKSIFIFCVLAFLTATLAAMINPCHVFSQESQAMLQVYPTPANVQESSIYNVKVNNQPIFVEQYNSINYVHFAFAGKADIEITYPETISNYTLSPKSINILSSKNSNKISFSLRVPRKLILHKVNGLNSQLYILADPLEDNPPRLGDTNVTNLLNYGVDRTGVKDITEKFQQAINDVSAKGVLYIPPGVYKTRQLNLKSNMTLYLAGGAILEATKEINPSYGRGLLQIEKVSNVKIMGRGQLYGNGSYWRSRGGWYSLIQLTETNNVYVEDILLIDPAVANFGIEYSENTTIYNVKILADPKPYFPNTDGFHLWSSRNITIDNILYKGTDDAIANAGDNQRAIKNNENNNIRNSIFYTGGGFKIGSQAKQDFIRNITYENIDVVFADALSGFWPVTGANFENIYFKNIRVEDMLDTPRGYGTASLFQWRIIEADWEPHSSVDTLGYIKDVYFVNLIVAEPGSRNSVFQGYDSKRDIRNIIFDNFYIQGKLILKPSDANFNIENQYVDLRFSNSNPTIVEIEAPQIDAKSGNFGQFRITRTGDTSHPLRVNYIIRGTANNGSDYQSIPNFVTIPSGKTAVIINIQPQRNQQQQTPKSAIQNKLNTSERFSRFNKGFEPFACSSYSALLPKTILLTLKNLPNSTDYLLGPNFQSMLNINN